MVQGYVSNKKMAKALKENQKLHALVRKAEKEVEKAKREMGKLM